MPRLPTAQDLGTRVAQNRSQVVDPSSSVAPVMQAQGQLVSAAQQFTNDLKSRRDQMALHKARISYQKALIEAESIYDDPSVDLDTALTRHEDALRKARTNALQMVGNKQLQGLLSEDLDLAQLKALDAGRSRLTAIEADRGLADMNEILSTAREVALVRDFDTAMDVANDAITTARGSGYIDAVQEQGLREKYSREVAAAAISVKPLKEQKEILAGDHPLSKVLPTDTRKKLLEDVSGRLVVEDGMRAADEIRLAGGSREERRNKAMQIKDPDVRQAALRQVEHDLQQEKLALAETQYDAYQSLAKEVIAGNSSAQVITANPQAWDALSAEQQIALKNMDAKQGTDIGVYNHLNQLASTSRDRAYDYFLANAHKLSPSDAMKWSDRLAKPEELDGYLTRSQRLGRMLNDAGIKKDSDRYYRALEAVDKDVLAFEQQNGKKPNPKEEQEILNTVFDKVVDSAWFNPFSSDQFGFDLSQQQRTELRESGQLEKFEQILSDYQAARQGSSEVPIVLSDDEIALIYSNAKRMGMLDE